MVKGDSGSGRRAGSKGREPKDGALRFSPVNAFVGLAGMVALTLGYVLLAQGSVTAAPLLLVLGYVVLLPLAIIL
jgi:hypothetical protein